MSIKFKTVILVSSLLFSYLFVTAQVQIGTDINGVAPNNVSGKSVDFSADGSTVVIGGPGHIGGGIGGGQMRVFHNNSGTWTQVGANINGTTTENIGWSVAISDDGNTIASGAFINSNVLLRVYHNNLGVWSQVGSSFSGTPGINTIVNNYDLTLSGDGTTLAIGIPSNLQVTIFHNTAGVWSQVGSPINILSSNANHYSVSLSADGTTIAIGDPGNSGGFFFNGQTKVFHNTAGTWTQVGLAIEGEAMADFSGYCVSISADGTTLAIGAQGNDVNGSNSGNVRVFHNTAGTWTQVGSNINGEAAGDQSGYNISISSDGTILAIGAYSNTGNGVDSGHVRIYRNIANVWTKIGADIDGEAAGDESGYSISLAGNGSALAIGARKNDGNGAESGHVRLYDLSALLSSDSFVLDNFGVFPNPASEKITITLQKNLELKAVNIYNTLGQLIKTGNNNTINVSSFSKGSYFFEVITNKGKATKTIIIE